MMSGLAARTSSTSMCSFLRIGARFDVTNTSAVARMAARARRPSSLVRSQVTLRLPRLGISRNGLGPSSRRFNMLRRARCGSPLGGSILMTSAPRSASTAPAAGTNVQLATSTTRTPLSGPVMAPPFCGRSCCGWCAPPTVSEKSALYGRRPADQPGAPGDGLEPAVVGVLGEIRRDGHDLERRVEVLGAVVDEDGAVSGRAAGAPSGSSRRRPRPSLAK